MDVPVSAEMETDRAEEQRELLLFLTLIIGLHSLIFIVGLLLSIFLSNWNGLVAILFLALEIGLMLLAYRDARAGASGRAVEIVALAILYYAVVSQFFAPDGLIATTLGTLIVAVLAVGYLEGGRLRRLVILAWLTAGIIWLIADLFPAPVPANPAGRVVVFLISLLIYGLALLLLWQGRARLQRQNRRAVEANASLRTLSTNLEATVAARTAELSQALARYQIVSELTSDYAYSVTLREDGTGTTDWATDAIVRITGYTPAEIDARGFRSIVYPEDLPIVLRRIERVLAGREDVSEFRIVRRDGAVRWLRAFLRPVHDAAQGQVTRAVGAMEDITDRRLIEEQYRQLVELAPDAIIVHVDNVIVFVNPAAVRLLGANDRAALIDRRIFDFIAPEFHGFARARLERIVGEWLSTPVSEVKLVRLDGTVVEVETSGGPFLYRGRPAVQAVMRDITARKQAEEERRILDLRMREAQRLESLGLLAGGVAHDFNNLLLGILGNASLLRLELPPDDPAHEGLAQIELAARRAAELTRQMLAYAGRGRLAVQPVMLSRLIEEMIQLLHSSIGKQIELILEIDSQLPAIEADSTQIRQVVMNLIINAAEAIGDQPGSIRVSTAHRQLDHEFLRDAYVGSDLLEGSYVVLTVVDTGSGMDAATMARIFDPFFTTKATGRGLGLAAVLGIVRGHHGALKVSSYPALGTTFVLALPVLQRSMAALVESPFGEDTSVINRQALILIVDDEQEVADIAARILRRAGYRTLCAASGRAALEVLETAGGSIDCVLLDMTMPGLSGLETLAAIRAAFDRLPVVLMSGYSEADALPGLEHVRPDAFMQKPFGAGDLQRLVARVLAGAH